MTIEEIDEIIEQGKAKDYRPTRLDIAFNLIKEVVGNEVASYLLYKAPIPNVAKYANSNKNKFLRTLLKQHGIDCTAITASPTAAITPIETKKTGKKELTKEENREALMAELEEISRLQRNGELDAKDAIMARARIRFELNKNFEMEKSEDERKIIVVPQKHDIVCPHSHRECTYMPTKEACMEYYNLKEA